MKKIEIDLIKGFIETVKFPVLPLKESAETTHAKVAFNHGLGQILEFVELYDSGKIQSEYLDSLRESINNRG
jgi:hypothetical protein